MTWIAPPAVAPTDEPLTGPERPILQAFLESQRYRLRHRCAGLTGEQLAQRSVEPSGLSLLGLIRHLAKVERIWFRERVAGQRHEPMFGDGRRDADFEDVDPDAAEADYQRFLEECRLADEAVADLPLDHTFELRGDTYSLRVVYIHMVEEYAQHNGHADLLRERIDGSTGDPA